jgi:hypothetical protein
MKKILVVLFALLTFALGACTTAQQQTVAEAAAKAKTQIANACLVVQPTLVNIQASMAAAPDDQKTLIAAVVAGNAKICSGASVIDTASAQSLVNSVIPETISALALLPIDPAAKMTIQIALGAASVALSNFIVVYGQPVATQ